MRKQGERGTRVTLDDETSKCIRRRPSNHQTTHSLKIRLCDDCSVNLATDTWWVASPEQVGLRVLASVGGAEDWTADGGA